MFLQEYGNIDDYEMYQIFNMGMGFAIIVEEADASETIKTLQTYSDATVKRVGIVQKGAGVEVPSLKLRYH
jgi:phosphoribosylformylglycinamidine cyclo-ligase